MDHEAGLKAAGSVPITRESFPWFLRALDADPQKAAAGFHEFAWKLLRSSPPPRFRGLPEQDREDIIADLVAQWLSDDFRTLRAYRDTGRPFAGYVATAANNRASDHWRRQMRRGGSIDDPEREAAVLVIADPGEPLDARAVDRIELEEVSRCVQGLSERCQVLVQGAADGLKPRELALLLGWSVESNKKAHDALRECRKSLVRCMKKKQRA